MTIPLGPGSFQLKVHTKQGVRNYRIIVKDCIGSSANDGAPDIDASDDGAPNDYAAGDYGAPDYYARYYSRGRARRCSRRHYPDRVLPNTGGMSLLGFAALGLASVVAGGYMLRAGTRRRR